MRSRQGLSGGSLIIISGLIFFCLVLLVSSASYVGSKREVTAEITGKERVCESLSDEGQECRYLVFTSEGTFQIRDSLLIGRWTSSDTYGMFREDRTYTFDVVGWRLGFFSTYPNVASDPVEVGEAELS